MNGIDSRCAGPDPRAAARPRRGWGHWLFAALMAVAVVLLVALGIWQLERLAWKQALIARVDARVHAEPVAAPPVSEGPDADADGAARLEYLRVRVRGRLRHDLEIPVYASTERGPGYWIMTPLQTATGTIWINRGFVDNAHRDRSTRPADTGTPERSLVGLLRLPERNGLFLRANVAAQDRWYRRDPQEMAAARDLAGPVAPWFIDAQPEAAPDTADAAGAAPAADAMPIAGMTVIRFRTHHLSYALTWFGLAALAVLALGLVMRSDLRPRGRRRRIAGKDRSDAADAGTAQPDTRSPDRWNAAR